MTGHGECPVCKAMNHEILVYREDRPVRRESYDPRRAAIMMASMGLMEWDEAPAAKGGEQVIFVAGKASSSADSKCSGCGATVTWASFSMAGEIMRLEHPVSWGRAG